MSTYQTLFELCHLVVRICVSANIAIYSEKIARVDASIQKCLQVFLHIKRNAAIIDFLNHQEINNFQTRLRTKRVFLLQDKIWVMQNSWLCLFYKKKVDRNKRISLYIFFYISWVVLRKRILFTDYNCVSNLISHFPKRDLLNIIYDIFIKTYKIFRIY